MKREALVPIDEELRAMIAAQQDRNRERWPAGTPVLFPRPHSNIDGTRPLSTSSYRSALRSWLERCDIRDEHGQPVRLTPHQWRHTLGTTLKMSRVASDASFRRIGECVWPAVLLTAGQAAAGQAMW
jgi:integrase